MTRPRISPWRLTPCEANMMDAFVDTGCMKLVARSLGIALTTTHEHATNARAKIGVTNTPRAAVLWDRWRRESK